MKQSFLGDTLDNNAQVGDNNINDKNYDDNDIHDSDENNDNKIWW